IRMYRYPHLRDRWRRWAMWAAGVWLAAAIGLVQWLCRDESLTERSGDVLMLVHLGCAALAVAVFAGAFFGWQGMWEHWLAIVIAPLLTAAGMLALSHLLAERIEAPAAREWLTFVISSIGLVGILAAGNLLGEILRDVYEIIRDG